PRPHCRWIRPPGGEGRPAITLSTLLLLRPAPLQRRPRGSREATGGCSLLFSLLSPLFLCRSAEACNNNGRAGEQSRRPGITRSGRTAARFGEGATRSVSLRLIVSVDGGRSFTVIQGRWVC
ncbi:Os12g0235200, partial [Oryza sativa Japonica Group]